MPPRRIAPVRDEVTIRVDGEDVSAERGEPIAVALAASGRVVLGRSVKYHRPRGPTCYAGRCDGCLMRVDGVPSRMTCRLPCEPGVDVETQNVIGLVPGRPASVDLLAATDWFFPDGMNHHDMFTWSKPINRAMQTVARRIAGVGTLPDEPAPPIEPIDRGCDVLVIGAGPSGLTCAAALAGAGLSVLVIDEEETPGGHLVWEPGAARDQARTMADAARRAGAELVSGCSVVAIYEPGPEGMTAIADGPARLLRIRARRVVIAQGRHEGAWAFEGNDLPGVIGCDAACRLLARGVRCGDRPLLAGGGERMAALATALRAAGADVVGPIDLDQLVRARGRNSVSSCDLRRDGRDARVKCDAIVIAPPSTAVYELAEQAGIEIAWRDGTFEIVAAREDGATRAGWARAIGSAVLGTGAQDLAQAVAAARAIADEVGRG